MTKLSVFVACPYLLFPMNDYKAVFAGISRSYPVTFRFADEQITSQHILEKISGYIRSHDISLFDITGWNPNVALELGIAVGQGKRYFILLNSHLDPNKDAPSDIKGIDRIQYTSNQELEAKLILLLKQEMPDESGSDSAFDNIKNRVVDTIKESPGIGVVKLSEQIGEEKFLVQSVVRALMQVGELKSKGATKATVYYTRDTDLRTVRRST